MAETVNPVIPALIHLGDSTTLPQSLAQWMGNALPVFATWANRINNSLQKDGTEAMTGTLVAPGATLNGKKAVVENATPTAGNLASWTADGIIQDAGTTANHAGRVAQVVSTETGTVATGTTQMPNGGNTVPTNTQGDQYMSLTITPVNASSTLHIDVCIFISSTIAAGVGMGVGLFQDTTANAIASAFVREYTGQSMVCVRFKHVMAAGTTSATTFKVRAGGGAAGTTTFNGETSAQVYGGTLTSSITITEYLP